MKSASTLVSEPRIFTDTGLAENTIKKYNDPMKMQLMARFEMEWFPGMLLMEDWDQDVEAETQEVLHGM